jgi:phosphoglucan, water dikinase
LAHELPHLSHLAVRARQAGVVLAACEEVQEFERIQRFAGRMISLLALPDKVIWEGTSEVQPTANQPDSPSPQIPTVRLDRASAFVPLADVVAETGGGKATGARQLAELSHRDAAGFSTSPAIVVPFGVMEAQLSAAPAVAAEYSQRVKRLDRMPSAESAAATQHLRQLVERLAVPDAILSEVARTFARNSRLVVRSSANCEDVEGLAGAGLYDSVINVAPPDVASAIRKVWSSLWTRRAALSRQQAGLPHEQAHMAVLIQEMVVPDFSFVLHTVNPINNSAEEVYAEIVVGLGETLASAATRGSPYRLVCGKSSGAVTTLAFANFSQTSQPNPAGGLRHETVDYSRVDLSRDASARQKLGQRLAAIGRFVEQALQRPQDIEGVVAGDRIWLVQARPQPGLRKS